MAVDTGETADLDNPPDYSWRSISGGCIGSIHCERCGCIMGMEGSSCFCMGIYTCPRCGFESKNRFTDKESLPVQNHDAVARTRQITELQRKTQNNGDVTSPIVYEKDRTMASSERGIDYYLDCIENWHWNRNLIDGSTDQAQIGKLEEEFNELKDSCAAAVSPIDDIGDMIVVLKNIAVRNNLTLLECLQHAWDEIKDRKGKMIDGIFVKEADLHKFE
jgi:hypothetical protein